MKIKTLVAMLFLSAGATTVVAQDALTVTQTVVFRMRLCVQEILKMRILPGKLCWKIVPHSVFTLLLTDIKSLKA